MPARGVRLQAAVNLLAALGKPVVAAITGYALGGGLEFALAADFRVAGERARAGQPEILLGVIPGAGGTQRLTQLAGPGVTRHLVYTGVALEAEETAMRYYAQLIERTFGVRFHPRYLNEWLTARDITPQKPKRQARERDQDEIDRWRRWMDEQHL